MSNQSVMSNLAKVITTWANFARNNDPSHLIGSKNIPCYFNTVFKLKVCKQICFFFDLLIYFWGSLYGGSLHGPQGGEGLKRAISALSASQVLELFYIEETQKDFDVSHPGSLYQSLLVTPFGKVAKAKRSVQSVLTDYNQSPSYSSIILLSYHYHILLNLLFAIF